MDHPRGRHFFEYFENEVLNLNGNNMSDLCVESSKNGKPWVCSKCTLHNATNTLSCICCGARRKRVFPVHETIIKAVRETISLPLIVGGGIRSQQQMDSAYQAGATMVVMGTALEEKLLKDQNI